MLFRSDNESNPVMPENETFCLVDATTNPPTYRLEGTVDAFGTFTSEGTSTLQRTYGDADAGQGETIEGAGRFEGTGTFNGTGLFIGVGTFSGPMVEPGSFYKTGLLPGTYNMIAQLANGKEVLLPDPVEIGIEPSYDLKMNMPGAIFTDTLETMAGDLLPNQTIELIDRDLGEEFAIMIATDEFGNFSYGPVPKGDYYYRVDLDNDGWYDLNESTKVIDDTTNITLVMGVPETSDVTLTLVSPVDPLTQEPMFDVSNRTITFENSEGILQPMNVTSDENGVLSIELLYGVWNIRDDVNTDFVLFDQVELTPQTGDVERDVMYAKAAYINGSMRSYPGVTIEEYDTWFEMTPEENRFETTEPATSLTVNFVSGALEFTSVTNLTGAFSVRVPSGFTYHITTESVISNRGYGDLVTVEVGENLDLGSLYLAPTNSVDGVLYLYDNSSRWDGSVPLWQPTEIVATNEDGLEWRTTTSDTADFHFDLVSGDWDFSVVDERLNVTVLSGVAINHSSTDQLSTLEMFAHPERIDVTMNVYLDGEDGTFENGTPVTPDFFLRPVNEDRESIYFTADDYSAPGNITVSLTPGGYDLVFNRTTADAENATDYDLVGVQFFEAIIIGLDPVEDVLDVTLQNTYRVNGTLTNSTGDGIQNDFLLYNEAEDRWFNIGSDENGSFAAYVPAGEWLVIVAPFSNNEVTETLRSPLSVNEQSQRLNLALQTQESVGVTMQLKEYMTNDSLGDMTVTAVSHDGFGNITFERTDENGNATELMMPGTWSLFLNRTVGTQSWFLDTSSAPFTTDDADNNSLVLEPVYATLEVEIGGKVYWDLDNNSLPGTNEGIPEVNVTVQGTNHSEFNSVVTTDENGVWRVFVPIRDAYNVTVEKTGFETVYYSTENESGFVVYDSPDSRDIEVSAGSVAVEGFVTDQLDAARLEGANIVLYPVAGVERDAMVIEGIMNGTTLEWSANIQPGDWVVIVTEANPGPNGGGVAIGLLEASVAEGGNISLVMALGGYVDLATAWTDIEQNVHHAGTDDEGSAMIQDAVEVEVTFDGMSWMMSVPTSGELTQLFPEGSVSFDSEFMTVQHERALEMEYYGGQTTSVSADSTITATLSYNRRVNSNLDIVFNEVSVGSTATVLSAGDDNELQALVSATNNSLYTTIEFEYDVAYNGTEASDLFTVSGEMGLAQDSDLWTVMVWNASANDGEGAYEESVEIRLGIGDANTEAVMSAVVRIQITLPEVEEAWHLANGHRMTLRMETDLGEATQASLKVFIPQTFGFELSEQTTELGMSALVERSITFDVTNTGNGQESYNIELLDSGVPEGWSVTPMTSTLTLSKGETRTQQFTVFAPESFTEGFDLTIYVNSQDETVDSETVVVSIKSARVKLVVEGSQIATESNNEANTPGSVVVPIRNDGLLDAPSVIVYLEPVTAGLAERQVTISVPAGETVNAEFTDLTFAQGTQRFNIRVEVAGAEGASADETQLPSGDNFQLRFYSSGTSDGGSNWETLIIALLGILIIYGGMKTARSRGGTKF